MGWFRHARRVALFVAIAGVTMVVYTRFVAPRPQALPVIGHVPELALVDQTGAPFTAASLRGHVWVADFIFTSCHSSCPALTAKMRHLEDMLAKGPSSSRAVRLVSFSVDPENDTPAVLEAYAREAGADPKVWSFVTGPSDAMRAAVVSGFKMTADRVAKGGSDYDVIHGNWFVLGDGEGNIRGYYETDTDDDVDAIARDATQLAAASR